eukprot:c6104_g1_i1.p1 GENE.c6104_g1_i1~~c6104_g1_i1.p1  ORF type:complete len:345 (+),score=39.60 c6104_g1_i1:49-1083(+)
MKPCSPTTSWRSAECPGQFLCIPENGGVCSCEWTTDLLRDINNGTQCAPSTASYVISSLWLFLAVIAGINTIIQLCTCVKYRGHLRKFDTLATSYLLVTGAALAMTCHFLCRSAYAVVMKNSEVERIREWFIYSSAVYAFFLTFSNVFFGLSLLLLYRRVSAMTVGSKNTQSVMVALLLGFGVFASQLILNFARQYALLNLISATIAVISWISYRRVYLQLVDLRKAQTNTVRVQVVMTHMAAALRICIATMVGLLIGAALYALFWYIGRRSVNRTLLGPWLLLSVYCQHIAMIWNVVGMGVKLRHLFEFRMSQKVSIGVQEKQLGCAVAVMNSLKTQKMSVTN